MVYTPAIPSDSLQFGFFRDGGFEIVKRSRMLGVMVEGKYLMAVAGTHGKTTTSTMAAWFDREAGGGGSAFLAGFPRISVVTWCSARGNDWSSRPTSSIGRFCSLYPRRRGRDGGRCRPSR